MEQRERIPDGSTAQLIDAVASANATALRCHEDTCPARLQYQKCSGCAVCVDADAPAAKPPTDLFVEALVSGRARLPIAVIGAIMEEAETQLLLTGEWRYKEICESRGIPMAVAEMELIRYHREFRTWLIAQREAV
jgi:dissimilatory sulfite reductase (desulfoviridin) alpha/beta subunit